MNVVLVVLAVWTFAAIVVTIGWSRWFRYQRAADERDEALEQMLTNKFRAGT